MNKKEALKLAFDSDLIFECWNSNFKFTAEQLLDAISKEKYSLSKELGLHNRNISPVLDYFYPDRPKIAGYQICTYILKTHGKKFCSKCSCVKLVKDFGKEKSKKDGLSTYCNECNRQRNQEFRNLNPDKSKEHSRNNYYKHKSEYIARNVVRREVEHLAIPSWSQLEQIKDFYDKCPEGYHVDHIIPLRGTLVSGLHVIENLQYLLAEDNIRKSNKYDPMAE